MRLLEIILTLRNAAVLHFVSLAFLDIMRNSAYLIFGDKHAMRTLMEGNSPNQAFGDFNPNLRVASSAILEN